MASEEKVGVIVPMYNAEKTVGETLASVCNQTWRALDIVVVDDGSTDSSADIVAEAARQDPRIRLLRQSNEGVAAARNKGAASAKADILAFLDADDLWAPEKIAAQVEVLAQAGGAALVYCWFVQIDARGRIYSESEGDIIEGCVTRQICRSNFVGNCSSLLLPRRLFSAVGGFDPSLKQHDAQGCEDLLFFAKVARQFEFRVVPRHLLGYRLTNTNMSSDTARMLRSFELVAARLQNEMPQHAAAWRDHRRDFILWLSRRAAIAGRLSAALRLVAILQEEDLMETRHVLPGLAKGYALSKLVPRWAKNAAETAGLKPRRMSYLALPW